MRAGAGAGQAVEFEGMGERAVGERRRRRLHRAAAAAAEDMAGAAGAGTLGIVDDDAAPGQRAAADAGGNRVDDRILGAGHHRFRQILVAQRRGIAGQLHGFFGHHVPPVVPRRRHRVDRFGRRRNNPRFPSAIVHRDLAEHGANETAIGG
jgi:hypothetical protein